MIIDEEDVERDVEWALHELLEEVYEGAGEVEEGHS